MTARSKKNQSKSRYELILRNENHEAYQDIDAPGTEQELTKRAVEISKAVRSTMPAGTWTVELWRSVDNSDGNLLLEIDAKGTVRLYDIPTAMEQSTRKGATITFRTAKEQMIAATILTGEGMKGLTAQILDADKHNTLTFTDAQTAKQADNILAGHDLAQLAKKHLR